MSATETALPIPLSPSAREELDLATHELLGHDFGCLLDRCRIGDEEARSIGGSKGWRPSGPGTLAIRIALEVAIEAAERAEDERQTLAEQIVERLDDALWLGEQEHWVLADGSVLEIGEGEAVAKAGAVETRK